MRFKNISKLIVFSLLIFSKISLAETENPNEINLNEELNQRSSWLGFNVETLFPVYLGIGPNLLISPQWELSLLYGFTPKLYYQTIGTLAASFSGNSAYKDVIDAAFQNNSLYRLNLTYHFEGQKKGWGFGAAISKLQSSGKAEIQDVLVAGTGNNYTSLINLLHAAGKDTQVDMNSNLSIGELFFTYTLSSSNRFFVTGTFGVAQVLSSDVTIKTGLPNFEASNAGKNLLNTTESDIEQIIVQYGLCPTLGAQLSYIF